jgi:3-hydroxybutyryl-CoA dehydratase
MEKQINKGAFFEHHFSFKKEDVIKFAEATGDDNPIHLDEDFAKGTIFGRPIIHGFLGASVFSKVFGTIFPGNGTIYLKQSFSFFKPMYVSEEYKATFLVTETVADKNRATVATKIFDKDGGIVIDGEAVIKHISIL